MPGCRPIIAAIVLAVAGATAAGCGSSDDISGTIPAESSATLLDRLNTVQQRVEAGDCAGARAAADSFVTVANGVQDTEVREALIGAGENLEDLTSEPGQCEEEDTGTTGLQDEQETTTPPPTTTAPPPTTTTATTTDTTTAAPPGNQGQGGGNTGGGPSTDGGGSGTDGGTGGGTGGTGGGTGE